MHLPKTIANNQQLPTTSVDTTYSRFSTTLCPYAASAQLLLRTRRTSQIPGAQLWDSRKKRIDPNLSLASQTSQPLLNPEHLCPIGLASKLPN